MSYNCFFGVELTPAAQASPAVPPQTSLVLSQVCVAAQSTYRGRVSVVVEGPKQTPIVIATLHPEMGIFHVPLQLVFGTTPKLSLVVNRAELQNPKYHRNALDGASLPQLEAGCRLHLTGYYEREADALDDDDADDDDEEEEEEDEHDE